MRHIHAIPYNRHNTPGFYTFVEALKSWSKAGPDGFRGVTSWDHWHVMNMWLYEEEELQHSACPDCDLYMDADGACRHCDQRSWTYPR